MQNLDDGSVLHQPPPAEELPRRLKDLCEFANAEDKLPAVIRASLLHFQLGHDHPFTDGNGRTARALFYWHMLKKGFAAFRYLAISKAFIQARAAYARAYVHTEQTGDLNYFLLYHLEAIRRASDDFVLLVQKKLKQRRQAEKAFGSWGSSFNPRQRLLVMHALKHPDATYTATAHMGWHGVTRQTALTDLDGLVRAELFARGKSGREHVFRPADGLADRLAKPS